MSIICEIQKLHRQEDGLHNMFMQLMDKETFTKQDRKYALSINKQIDSITNKILDLLEQEIINDERFDERAGVFEYDGGLPREEAEKLARLIVN